MNMKYAEEVMRIISQRKTKAITENEMRRNEINEKIPELTAINYQLYRTNRDLIEIVREGVDVEQRVMALSKRNLQAQEMRKNLLIQNGYPVDYLEIRYSCPICEDTGYKDGLYCQCFRKLYTQLAVGELNKTAQVNLSTFESFNLEYYRNYTTPNGTDAYKVMDKIYRYCFDYAKNFKRDSESIMMFGRTGLGKTHLSLAIASTVTERGYTVVYDSIINLLGKIEKEHFGKKKDPETDTLAVILGTDLLIMDDLGTEYDTTFNVSTVYNIINTRLNKNMPTIVSTNLNLEKIRSRYEERIVSRLFASYMTLEFAGEDIRSLKRKQG